MDINLSVRVSSKVLLVPKRAETNDCTLSSSCSSNALNASSDLAKANVSLPVVGLIFLGGSTPRLIRSSANLLLDIKSFLSVMFASRSSLSLRSRTSSRCCSNKNKSRSSVGSINIRNVRSISCNSCCGNWFPTIPLNINLKISYVRSTSLREYSAYFAISSSLKSVSRLANARVTSSPLAPTP